MQPSSTISLDASPYKQSINQSTDQDLEHMSHRGWCHGSFTLPKPVGYVMLVVVFVAADLIYRFPDQDHTSSDLQKQHLVTRALQARTPEALEKIDGHVTSATSEAPFPGQSAAPTGSTYSTRSPTIQPTAPPIAVDMERFDRFSELLRNGEWIGLEGPAGNTRGATES